MSWNYHRAKQRILDSITSSPAMRVESFTEQYQPRIEREMLNVGQAGSAPMAIRDLRPGDAVLVDTVQMYINVANYDDMRLDAGQETEASHARALSFLHLHYASMDRASDGVGAQRVDYHGPRMHAVFIARDNKDEAGLRAAVSQALRLANLTIAIAEAATRDIARSSTMPQFRVGIDIGRCVAIDSGRTSEREPLFIGSAANHAAKLAAGTQPGIYLSDNVRRLYQMPEVGGMLLERAVATSGETLLRLNEGFVADSQNIARSVDEIRTNMRQHRDATIGRDGFSFHYHNPPLCSIDYTALSPANSIRMPLVSIFADLDRYTAYIDQAMANGRVSEAVRDLHVIRAELDAVLQQDFEGRKVRFIGDCIHGLIAVGSSTATDLGRSVEKATACAGALRSSFELCRDEFLPTAHSLGLAIGFEVGWTPVSRIGIRGERSVRVASSFATIASEECQGACDGYQTKIGEKAYGHASPDTRSLFGAYHVASDLDFERVIVGSAPAAAAAGEIVEPVEHNRSHNKR